MQYRTPSQVPFPSIAKCDRVSAPRELSGRVFNAAEHRDWIDARGRVLSEPGEIDEAYRALRTKYSSQMRLGDFFSKLSGRHDRLALLEITT